MSDRPSEAEITKVIGLLHLNHPELIDRVDYPTLREIAREEFRAALAYQEVPEPFRRAFEEPER